MVDVLTAITKVVGSLAFKASVLVIRCGAQIPFPQGRFTFY